MKRFVHPLLLLLARATEKELVQIIEYLKTENRTLRNKLPKRIDVTPALGNVPIDTDLPPPALIESFSLDDIICHESLGGLLKHYERRAA